jgi:hypothetical protein
MDSFDLRFLVAVILRSDASLFARLRLHSCKVLQQLSVEVFPVTGQTPLENFPSRREHFVTLVDWLECQTPEIYGQSLQTMCSALSNSNVSFESRAVFLSLVLPAVLALPLHESVASAPIATLKSQRCSSPLIVVQARSTRELAMKAGPGASTAIVTAESLNILREIGSGKLPAVPYAIAGTTGVVNSAPSWWNDVTWTDICDIASSFGPALQTTGKRSVKLQDLEEPTQKFALLQLESSSDGTVSIPVDAEGQAIQNDAMKRLEMFEQWAGPFSPDRLQNSLWKHRVTGEIVTRDDMLRRIFDAVPLSGGMHFAHVAVDTGKELSGGNVPSTKPLTAGSATDQILNRVVGDDKTLPKTFSIVPDENLFQPWAQGSTLADISFATTNLTDIQVRGILFQIVWTLAVLQKEFEGFQHNTLATSIRLVRFGKTRCFRVKGTDGGFTFCIPPSVPLPIVTHFGTANALAAPLPVRPTADVDDQKDLMDVLKVMTKYTFGVDAFQVARDLQKECETNCRPARIVIESSFDKTQVVNGYTLQQLMFNDAFDVFVSKAGPSSSAVAQVDTL